MIMEGRTGPTFVGDGVQEPVRLDRFLALTASQMQPDYAIQTFRQNLYQASVQAGVTSSVGLTLTYTGLVISNPLGSGKLLIPTHFSVAQSVINTAVNAIGIACGYSATTNVTHGGAVTVRNNYFGVGAAGVGLADTASTLPTAPFYTGPWVADTPVATSNPSAYEANLAGRFIIPPGGWIMMAAIAASPASALWPSFQWLEMSA